MPAVFELGAFCGASASRAVTLLTLTRVPAALALLPLPRASRRRTDAAAAPLTARRGARSIASSAPLRRLSRRRDAARSLVGARSSIAAAAALIPRIVIDTDYLSFFDEDSPVRRDFERVNELLAGAVPLYVVLDGDGAGAFREPAALRAIEQLQQAGSTRVPGRLAHDLRRRHAARAEPRDRAATTRRPSAFPRRAPRVAELLFLLPKGELARFATVDQARANLVVRTGAVGSASVRELGARIEAVLADGVVPEGLRRSVTGNAILLLAQRRRHRVEPAAQLGRLADAHDLRAARRSRCARSRSGSIAMVPNVIPVVIFFGMLGAGVAPLSLPTSLIASVALGIAIDDTVHFLVRYRGERRAGATPEEAVPIAPRARSAAPIVDRGADADGGLPGGRASRASRPCASSACSRPARWRSVSPRDLMLLPAMLVRGGVRDALSAGSEPS